ASMSRGCCHQKMQPDLRSTTVSSPLCFVDALEGNARKHRSKLTHALLTGPSSSRAGMDGRPGRRSRRAARQPRLHPASESPAWLYTSDALASETLQPPLETGRANYADRFRDWLCRHPARDPAVG